MAKIEKLGVQLYTIRDYLGTEDDVKRSFERLKKLGYDEAQTAGCAVPFDVFGKAAKDAGIKIVGTHEDLNLIEDIDKGIKAHEDLGTKIMGIGGFWSEDLAGYEKFVARANAICAKIGPKGYKFTYHNHSHEFRNFDGVIPFEYLFENFDKKYASFCADTYWIQHGGADVRYWIDKLTGRIDILHLKDMAMGPNGQYITQVGSGNLYWEGIIETANKAGVKHYVVEQDSGWFDNDPFKSLEMSSNYLHEKFM